jgi:hypothetical protein
LDDDIEDAFRNILPHCQPVDIRIRYSRGKQSKRSPLIPPHTVRPLSDSSDDDVDNGNDNNATPPTDDAAAAAAAAAGGSTSDNKTKMAVEDANETGARVNQCYIWFADEEAMVCAMDRLWLVLRLSLMWSGKRNHRYWPPNRNAPPPSINRSPITLRHRQWAGCGWQNKTTSRHDDNTPMTPITSRFGYEQMQSRAIAAVRYIWIETIRNAWIDSNTIITCSRCGIHCGCQMGRLFDIIVACLPLSDHPRQLIRHNSNSNMKFDSKSSTSDAWDAISFADQWTSMDREALLLGRRSRRRQVASHIAHHREHKSTGTLISSSSSPPSLSLSSSTSSSSPLAATTRFGSTARLAGISSSTTRYILHTSPTALKQFLSAPTIRHPHVGGYLSIEMATFRPPSFSSSSSSSSRTSVRVNPLLTGESLPSSIYPKPLPPPPASSTLTKTDLQLIRCWRRTYYRKVRSLRDNRQYGRMIARGIWYMSRRYLPKDATFATRHTAFIDARIAATNQYLIRPPSSRH